MKNKIYLLGLITLIGFPIPTFIYRMVWKEESFRQIFEFENSFNLNVLFGLAFGIAYALLAIQFFKIPIFKNEALKQQEMIQSMNLDYWDAVFLSICAGVGEELLFRSGIQLFAGPIITSLIFIAIHGYFNPMNWRLSLYGILLTPFILGLAYGYEYLGLWFSIAAHFSYDWVLFNENIRQKDKQESH